MRLLYSIILMCLSIGFSSCRNTDSVNILIRNDSDGDCRNVRVAVAMDDITPHLLLNDTDSLFVLNEANERIAFSFTPQGDSISFIVPILNNRSQKNYTINAREKRVADYIFRFRTANVVVVVDEDN